MFTAPMQVGIADLNHIPQGWHLWEIIDTTPRMRAHARMLYTGTLPARVAIVRAVPGIRPDVGLLALCEGEWPVSAEEIESLRSRRDFMGVSMSDFYSDDDTARGDVRAGDPHRGYALTAPVHLTDAQSTHPGADSLYSAHYAGRIRYAVRPRRLARGGGVAWFHPHPSGRRLPIAAGCGRAPLRAHAPALCRGGPGARRQVRRRRRLGRNPIAPAHVAGRGSGARPPRHHHGA